jgi:hypothetical protein
MFQPMMERQQHTDDDDFYAEHFPWFMMCYLHYLMVCQQYDELEKEDE